MYSMEIQECVSCEQLIFPGDEVTDTREGVVCDRCADVSEALALVSY